jgi:hypothetical protein
MDNDDVRRNPACLMRLRQLLVVMNGGSDSQTADQPQATIVVD